MNITVEISMYPLNEAYETPILNFIERLNMHKNINVKTNATSTHITGNYDVVFDVLRKEIKTSFEQEQKVIMVTKILNTGLNI